MIYACTTFGLCFFPGVFVSSTVTGACPVTTDLIMRVNVRTTGGPVNIQAVSFSGYTGESTFQKFDMPKV